MVPNVTVLQVGRADAEGLLTSSRQNGDAEPVIAIEVFEATAHFGHCLRIVRVHRLRAIDRD